MLFTVDPLGELDHAVTHLLDAAHVSEAHTLGQPELNDLIDIGFPVALGLRLSVGIEGGGEVVEILAEVKRLQFR